MQSLARFQALVIGVGDYVHFSDLPETVADATQFKQTLIDPLRCGYPPDRVQLLVGPDATAANILTGLNTLALNAVGNTTTVVYFSGHGGQAKDDPTHTYLLPREADATNLSQTALSNTTFSDALAEIDSRRLVVVLDACHASGAANFKGIQNVADKQVEAKAFSFTGNFGQQLATHRLREGSGRVIFASSRQEQLSWTYPAGHMSLFTYYLIEGLRGQARVDDDGTIRVFDLFHFVSRQVTAKKRNQEPLLAARDVSQNFPIALSSGRRKASDQLPAVSSHDDLNAIRDVLTQDARQGIHALANYLKPAPVELLEATGCDLAAVELKLAQFNELDKRIRIVGRHASWEAERNEIIYFFIQLCIDLQRILID